MPEKSLQTHTDIYDIYIIYIYIQIYIYKFTSKLPSPNIPDLEKARQELPLADNRIGALEPSYTRLLPY